MSDPKPEVAPRPKAPAGIDPVVRQKVQAAKTTLGMKDVNVSAALAAHQRLNDLVAKNPNVPTTRLMGRLSTNQAKSYYALSSRVPPSQLSSGIPLTKFRNTLRVIKTADQAAAAAEKAAYESVEVLDKEQVSEMLTGGHEQNPPTMIVLRRRGIRIFPDGRRVALYDNKQLGLVFTIPYKGSSFEPQDIPNVTTEGFDDYEQIAKELVKKHGKNVTMDHIDDLEKERDSRSALDKDEVMQHVKKLTEAAPSDKEVKMAKGIAYGKRYKGGNMTAAVDAIEKIRPGLSNHPDVKTALRTANEEVEQIDEVNARYNMTQALTPKGSNVKAAVGTTARDKATTNKYARRISKLTGGEYSKQDVKANLKSLANEEVELEESMTDSWKNVQSMPKGSVTGGKEEIKQRHAYLTAVYNHHKKYGNDTSKVRKEIESLNRSRVANEEAEQVTENLDALAKIAKDNKAGTIKFKDGTSTKVHPQVAGIVHQLHGALNPENKKKVENMIAHSAGQFDKIADFAVSKSQWTINNK